MTGSRRRGHPVLSEGVIIRSADPEIIVVGGSLAGLTFALASAARGVPVRVIERKVRRAHGGDNLNVDLAAIAAAVGCDPRYGAMLPVVHAFRDRHLTTWPALYQWLRDRAGETAAIMLEEDKTVASVHVEGDRAVLLFEDGSTRLADAVIGADGYRSTIRRAIAPEQPLAHFAGYVVWRGLIQESALSEPVRWPTDGGLWIELQQGYRLVAAVLPGRDGSLEMGRRQVTFAWFDARREELLRRTNCLTADGDVIGTLDAHLIGEDIRDELVALVPQLWPATWAEAVRFGVRAPGVMRGAPIAEYRPERLVLGPLTMVGDAAHVLSPMTGSGYASGVGDATLLSDMLSKRENAEPLPSLLKRYEAARLPYIRELVSHSRRLSAEYLRYASRF